MSKDLNPEQNQEPTLTKLKPLVPAALTFQEARNCTFSAVIPRDVGKEQLLLSQFWAVVADRFHAFDLVNCIAADRSYFAQLLVLDCGRGYATMQLLHWHPLPALLTTGDGLPAGFEIFYAGPDQEARYCAKRVADGVLIVKGKGSRDECLKELLAHASLRG